jgi:hypothetical protein
MLFACLLSATPVLLHLSFKKKNLRKLFSKRFEKKTLMQYSFLFIML